MAWPFSILRPKVAKSIVLPSVHALPAALVRDRLDYSEYGTRRKGISEPRASAYSRYGEVYNQVRRGWGGITRSRSSDDELANGERVAAECAHARCKRHNDRVERVGRSAQSRADRILAQDLNLAGGIREPLDRRALFVGVELCSIATRSFPSISRNRQCASARKFRNRSGSLDRLDALNSRAGHPLDFIMSNTPAPKPIVSTTMSGRRLPDDSGSHLSAARTAFSMARSAVSVVGKPCQPTISRMTDPCATVSTVRSPPKRDTSSAHVSGFHRARSSNSRDAKRAAAAASQAPLIRPSIDSEGNCANTLDP